MGDGVRREWRKGVWVRRGGEEGGGVGKGVECREGSG